MIVHFYGSGHNLPRWARWLARVRLIGFILFWMPFWCLCPSLRRILVDGYAYRTDAAFGGFIHVDMTIDEELWTWNPFAGATIKHLGAAVMMPVDSMKVGLTDTYMTPAQWLNGPEPQRVAGVLYAVGLIPKLQELETCSTMTARFLGISRPCRTPRDVYEALRQGHFDNGRTS